ncbi:MAG: Sb-PDE family phosphodiesterase [Mangrovibacterium sp.]
MKRKALPVLLLCFYVLLLPEVKAQVRKEIRIPDILGYQTLKCDFHVKTVFSDGQVWPTVRVEEAWREGLDAIAIADLVDYQTNDEQLAGDRNRSAEIAKPLADLMGIVLIRGAEIAPNTSPGHLTAVFVRNANLLERESWWDACVEAKEQGAFLFMNDPALDTRQADSPVWGPEHTRLLNAGIVKGIEICTDKGFSQEAVAWSNEKSLVILGNSDIQGASNEIYKEPGKNRPITLVFALEKTESAIKAAVFDNRTAVYFNETLVADRRFLTPIFLNAVQVKSKKLNLANQDIKYLQLYNNSDIPFKLKQRQPSIGLNAPKEITLLPNRTVLVELEGISDELARTPMLKLYYEATNLLTKKGEKLPVNIDVPNL